MRRTLSVLSYICFTHLWTLSVSIVGQDSVERVENGLLPGIIIAGEEPPQWTLGQRMQHYKVPGVSVAVVDDGQIVWAKGYGTLRADGDHPVTTETLFQAASISKSVAAAGALSLVQVGKLDLDRDVNDELESWKVPENEFTEKKPVTLRGLLSHTAGMTVHGFPGYAAHVDVPALAGVLDGEGNTAPIRVDIEPGTLWRYSGGGYTVAQQLMIDVSGKSFPQLLQETVLTPVGMANSTYEQPLPGSRTEAAAIAHRSFGAAVVGNWHTYPEMAAAGLWTTPTDLAKFFIEVRRAQRGESQRLMSRKTAQLMLTEQKNGYGLGLALAKSKSDVRFGHGGSNAGYKCQAWLYLGSGDGVAVMTNGDQGGALAGEFLRAVAKEYNWPDEKPIEKSLATVDAEALQSLVGQYRFPSGPLLTVEALEDSLQVTIPGRGKVEMLPESESRFFALESGIPPMEFDEDGEGNKILRARGEIARKID